MTLGSLLEEETFVGGEGLPGHQAAGAPAARHGVAVVKTIRAAVGSVLGVLEQEDREIVGQVIVFALALLLAAVILGTAAGLFLRTFELASGGG